MLNAAPREIPISSLPYFARCKRCIQRRLLLGHRPPVWLVSNARTRARRHWLDQIRGRELSALGGSFPQGVLSARGKGIRSLPIHVPTHSEQVVLTGTLAIYAAIDERVSSVVYVDPPKPRLDGLDFRNPQLHGYRFAVSNPDNRAKWPGHVSPLGAGILAIPEGSQLLSPSAKPWLVPPPIWLKSEWQDQDLLELLRVILDVLESDPEDRFPAGTDCSWCRSESRAA